MELTSLQQSYYAQLLKAGVHADKAMKAASSMSFEQLNLIGHIWSDWSLVLAAYSLKQFSP